MTVLASDNVQPNPQRASATVFVKVIRDRSPPVFNNLPTTISVDEQTVLNTTVYTASATDSDLKGSIYYELVGQFPAQSFFQVNFVTGRISLRNNLLSDSLETASYTLTMQAYDTAYPNNKAQANLIVQVRRNVNGPVFSPQPARYERTISENYPIGDVIVDLTATDADGDKVTFIHAGNSDAQNYFYVNPDTGTISLRRLISGSSSNLYTFLVRATDSRLQAQTADATVVISIVRDREPPRFVSTPYITSVAITQATNTTFFSVLAQDNDLKGQIRYQLDGYQPGTDYFWLNSVTGEIYTRRPLTQIATSSLYTTFTLLVTAYDTGVPETTVSEIVTININRNLNTPQFGSLSYTETVYDFQPVGSNVVDVDATDVDITSPENIIIYDIDDNSGFFNIHPFNGIISINRQLYEDNRLSNAPYLFRVTATDQGIPSRTGTASVTINVIRNNGRPTFINAGSYNTQVSEGVAVLTNVLTVTATDSDDATTPNGVIRYSIESGSEGTNIFQINSVTGVITNRVALTSAPNDQYTMTVRATDQGFPAQSSQIPVTITIIREGLPSFDQAEYTVTFNEDLQVGNQIIQLQARDPLQNVCILMSLLYFSYSIYNVLHRIRIGKNNFHKMGYTFCCFKSLVKIARLMPMNQKLSNVNVTSYNYTKCALALIT